jgi:hypothetical protein
VGTMMGRNTLTMEKGIQATTGMLATTIIDRWLEMKDSASAFSAEFGGLA